MQAVLEASSSYKIKTLTQTKDKHKHSPTTRGVVNQKTVSTLFLSFSLRLTLDLPLPMSPWQKHKIA
jgi:hypothetical protein